MSLSYYEVYITSLRAFTAMGIPYGLNEDAAHAITWLELNNLKGIKKLSDLSFIEEKNFKQKIKLEKLISFKKIDFLDLSPFVNCPGILDYLYEKIKKIRMLETRFQNFKDQIVLLPFLKKVSNNYKSINLCWLDKNKKIICININKNKIIIGQTSKKIKILKDEIILQFLMQNEKRKFKNNLRIEKVTKIISFSNEIEQLKKSLCPNKTHWNNINKKANLTFVPSSKKSREKGAGGGDDND